MNLFHSGQLGQVSLQRLDALLLLSVLLALPLTLLLQAADVAIPRLHLWATQSCLTDALPRRRLLSGSHLLLQLPHVFCVFLGDLLEELVQVEDFKFCQRQFPPNFFMAARPIRRLLAECPGW